MVCYSKFTHFQKNLKNGIWGFLQDFFQFSSIYVFISSILITTNFGLNKQSNNQTA